jgi:hypothetical protein
MSASKPEALLKYADTMADGTSVYLFPNLSRPG